MPYNHVVNKVNFQHFYHFFMFWEVVTCYLQLGESCEAFWVPEKKPFSNHLIIFILSGLTGPKYGRDGEEDSLSFCAQKVA